MIITVDIIIHKLTIITDNNNNNNILKQKKLVKT
jgi:hypothetical protein